MAKRSPRPPKYRHHKARNCAVVRIDGDDKYLGPYNSPESIEKYNRLIGEWLIRGTVSKPAPSSPAQDSSVTPSAQSGPSPPITVLEFLKAYYAYAEGYYRPPSTELKNMKAACKPLRLLYGSVPVCELDQISLMAIQEYLVKEGLCRNVVNARMSRIRRALKRAVRLKILTGSRASAH